MVLSLTMVIKNAWDKKNGSIADINFILISLLKDAGIKAKPLLISTRDNGAINAFYPFLNQFNGVMAIVEDGEDTYVMNAADKFNPYNLVPYDVAFTNALVVDKNETGTVRLETGGKFNNNIFLTCSVDISGKLEGQATMSSSGYARNIRMEAIKKKKLNEIFEDNDGITIKVDSATVNNESDELLPLEQKVNFSGGMQASGDYSLLPFNMFTGLGKNQFIAEEQGDGY